VNSKPEGKQTRDPDLPPPPPAVLTLAAALGRLMAVKHVERSRYLTAKYPDLTSTDDPRWREELPSDAKPAPAPCWVYFMQEGYGAIKIGNSRQPEIRRADLQRGTPKELKILAILPGDYRIERRFHKALWRYRSHGEWFRRGDWLNDVLEWIAVGDDAEVILNRLAKK